MNRHLNFRFRHELSNDVITKLACRNDEATLDLLIDLTIPLDNLLQDYNRHHPPSHSVTVPDSLASRLYPPESCITMLLGLTFII